MARSRKAYARLMARHRLLTAIWIMQLIAEAVALIGIWQLDMLIRKIRSICSRIQFGQLITVHDISCAISCESNTMNHSVSCPEEGP